MKKYFLYNGNEQSGPFSIDDLLSKNLTTQTPIWYEGLNEWSTVGNLPELQNLFSAAPPPFPSQQIPLEEPKHATSSADPYYLANQKKKSPYRTLAIMIVLLVLILAGKLIYDQIELQNEIATRQNLVGVEEDAKKSTRDNITSFVTAELSDYLYSSWGGIKNLNVIINNNTSYIIDEVKVRIIYYKPNGTVWDSRIVTFNLLNPNTKNTIKVADTERGVKVEKEIVSIKSRALGLN
jgi:hypothetical protein